MDHCSDAIETGPSSFSGEETTGTSPSTTAPIAIQPKDVRSSVSGLEATTDTKAAEDKPLVWAPGQHKFKLDKFVPYCELRAKEKPVCCSANERHGDVGIGITEVGYKGEEVNKENDPAEGTVTPLRRACVSIPWSPLSPSNVRSTAPPPTPADHIGNAKKDEDRRNEESLSKAIKKLTFVPAEWPELDAEVDDEEEGNLTTFELK